MFFLSLILSFSWASMVLPMELFGLISCLWVLQSCWTRAYLILVKKCYLVYFLDLSSCLPYSFVSKASIKVLITWNRLLLFHDLKFHIYLDLLAIAYWCDLYWSDLLIWPTLISVIIGLIRMGCLVDSVKYPFHGSGFHRLISLIYHSFVLFEWEHLFETIRLA